MGQPFSLILDSEGLIYRLLPMGLTNSLKEGFMTDNIRIQEDEQILDETITNERIVEHPTKGKIRFKLPTLELQRKIDALGRSKKKILRDTIDKIPDPETPLGYRIVPAYKSRDVLAKEYASLGWWTDEHEKELQDVIRDFTTTLAELEMLQFESEQTIYVEMARIHDRFLKLFEESITDELKETLSRVTLVGGDAAYEDLKTIRDAAPSTEVDDLLVEVEVYRKQFDLYAKLANLHDKLLNLESERTALFQDSWQEQLQYHIKLAQVFVCCEYVDTNKPLYDSIDTLEKEPNIEFLRWVFTELQSFLQGTPREARERFSKYGFMDRLNLKKSSSDESPVQPQSKLDGDLQENKQITSPEVTAITDQSPTTN